MEPDIPRRISEAPPAGNHSTEMTSFKDLPPELRNRIYDITLIAEDDVWLVRETEDAALRTCLALLQTCHQVRDEAQGIFYHRNHICINGKELGRVGTPSSRRSPPKFLESLSEPRYSNIFSLTVWMKGFYTVITSAQLTIFEQLKHLRSLQHLHLGLEQTLCSDLRYRLKYNDFDLSTLNHPSLQSVEIEGTESWFSKVCEKLQRMLQDRIDEMRVAKGTATAVTAVVAHEGGQENPGYMDVPESSDDEAEF